MLSKIRDLVRGQSSAQPPARDLKDAAAGLLVEVALIDGKLDESERSEIEAALVRGFALAGPGAAALVEKALAHASSASDFHGYSRALNRELDHDAKAALVENLWRVVHADGRAHDYETNLLRRIAGLLHVEDRVSGAARKRAGGA